MKKLFFLVVCYLLGISNLSAQNVEGENIILTCVFTFSPVVPFEDTEFGGKETDPNRFCATINGKDLSIKVDTGLPARAEVCKENGALVAQQDFMDETEISLPAAGNYIVRILSGKTTVEGRFTAK